MCEKIGIYSDNHETRSNARVIYYKLKIRQPLLKKERKKEKIFSSSILLKLQFL